MDIQKLLANSGHEHILELQQETVSAFKEGNHLSVMAQTGSGKTLAFLLASAQHLDTHSKEVQLLVLVPTRELAMQVRDVFSSMNTGLKSTVCYGGHAMKDERNALIETPAVVIGTPGRILDHLHREHLDLSACKMIVIDEFDKCLEYGFENDMGEIRSFMPRQLKSIYVSATEMKELPYAWKVPQLHSLKFGEVETVAHLNQYSVKAPSDIFNTVYECLCSFGNEQSIVFCNYREVVDDVVDRLQELGIFCEGYHGGMNQSEREKALIKFSNRSVRTLVCTDLGSRGLDIEDVEHVIHYQFPGSEAAFIHRNGRTARAEKTGSAYIIASETQQLPEHITLPEEEFRPHSKRAPEPPDWITLFFNAGKKEKIRKMDIVGFLSAKGQLKQDQIGKIALLDHFTYTAIKRDLYGKTMKNIEKEKIKGKKVFVQKAK